MDCSYHAALIRHEGEMLDRIVWTELEKTRHRLDRKAKRLTSDYVTMDVIRCADPEFTKNVTDRTIQELAYRNLFGKKTNAKRIVKRAIKCELCLLYGKKG